MSLCGQDAVWSRDHQTSGSRGLCSKTFYGSNSCRTVISQSVCQCQSLPLQSSVRIEYRQGFTLESSTWLVNTRQGYKRLTLANTLAYYNTTTNIVFKGFIVQVSGLLLESHLTDRYLTDRHFVDRNFIDKLII